MKYKLHYDDLHEFILNALFPTKPNALPKKILYQVFKLVLKIFYTSKKLDAIWAERNDADFVLFIEKALKNLGFSHSIEVGSLEELAKHTPAIFVVNHSLGIGDIFLLPLLRSVVPNTTLVANEMTLLLDPTIEDCAIGVSALPGNVGRSARQMLRQLREGNSLLMFPSGDVSRFPTLQGGARDGFWMDTFFRVAVKTNVPIVPIHVDGSPSKLYIWLVRRGGLYHLLSQFLYFSEFLNLRDRHVDIRIGKPIDPNELDSIECLSTSAKANAIKEQVYSLKGDAYY